MLHGLLIYLACYHHTNWTCHITFNSALHNTIIKLCTCCLSNLDRKDIANRVMLAQCFKMISNAYNLDRI